MSNNNVQNNYFIKQGKFGSNLFSRRPVFCCTIIGVFGGMACETIMTFLKPPGGETFYDFQRRKECERKYGYEWRKPKGYKPEND